MITDTNMLSLYMIGEWPQCRAFASMQSPPPPYAERIGDWGTDVTDQCTMMDDGSLQITSDGTVPPFKSLVFCNQAGVLLWWLSAGRIITLNYGESVRWPAPRFSE